MDRISIEFSNEELREIHRAAESVGTTDEDFIKTSVKSKLPLHLQSDDEIGARIREENQELYKRLS
jgi:uncharacterized protein (DUF1778 family)